MLVIDYVKVVLICIAIVMAFFFLNAWFYALIKVKLGSYVVKGSLEEALSKIYSVLQERQAARLILDTHGGKVSIFGLTRSKLNLGGWNWFDGDHIKFVAKIIKPDEVQIDVIAYRSWNARFSFTKEQWQTHGYDTGKITELFHSLS
jgi:menaquinone-dependent protoporphyrinogen IX oxidase